MLVVIIVAFPAFTRLYIKTHKYLFSETEHYTKAGLLKRDSWNMAKGSAITTVALGVLYLGNEQGWW